MFAKLNNSEDIIKKGILDKIIPEGFVMKYEPKAIHVDKLIASQIVYCKFAGLTYEEISKKFKIPHLYAWQVFKLNKLLKLKEPIKRNDGICTQIMTTNK